MIDLYPFQVDLIPKLRRAVRKHRAVLLQLYPGGGKTVIAAHMVSAAIKLKIRTWFIVHRSELLYQTAKTYGKQGIDFGYIAADYPEDQKKLAQICSIDTLKNRLDSVIPPGMIIWDEAQHLGAAGYQKVMQAFPNCYHIGLSGTPHRLDGKGLYPSFKHMVLGPSPEWLIKNKYLADYRFFNPIRPDMSQVGKVAGDYNKKGANAVMSSTAITGSVLAHYKKYALKKRAILFATSIERSQLYAKEFRDAGISAQHIDGTTDKGVRRALSFAFASGDIDVLMNVNLFGEGYDLSAQAGMDCPVQVVLDCLPSYSLSRVIQMWMRAMRKQEEKCLIFDFSGNCLKHGLPDDDREWSLEGAKDQGQNNNEQDILDRQCPKCYAVGKSTTKCGECGYVFPVKSREVDEVAGELEEADKEVLRKQLMAQRKVDLGKARSVNDLMEFGKKNGYGKKIKDGRPYTKKEEEALIRWAGYTATSRKKAATKYRTGG